MRIVKKYGGSSVATIDKIKNIAQHLLERKNNVLKGEKCEIVVVLSAMGKTTNKLIELAKEITESPNPRELDVLMATGELQSIALLSIALENLGLKSISLSGSQVAIKTTGTHTKNKIETIDTKIIERYLNEDYIVVVAGFQGINIIGDTTTLGRGGSDTSAVALAATLNCDCEIYTDVKGIYSIDPRVYKDAKKTDKISYEEMMEMANLGAGVMEARAVEIGKKYGVKIYVGETLSLENGTYICDMNEIIEKRVVSGISINENVIMVSIEQFSNFPKNVSILFSLLAKNGINVDMISQSDVSDIKGHIAFTCPGTDEIILDKSLVGLKKEFPDILVGKRRDVGKISLVGIGMISNFGVAAKVFETLAETEISFHQCTTSEISISVIINKINIIKFVEKLAKNFSL